MFDKTITAVRLLLGVQYLMSGLNWYYKFLPFPSLSDGMDFPHKHEVAAAMIATGWMFDLAKLTELVTGLGLLLNRFVPLVLAASMPVALTTFLLDAFILDTVLEWFNGQAPGAAVWADFLDMVFFGGVVLLMQAFLMLSYLDYYKPMLKARSPLPAGEGPWPGTGDNAVPGKIACTAMLILAVLSLILGLIADLWYVGMVDQWLIPWGSLKVLSA